MTRNEKLMITVTTLFAFANQMSQMFMNVYLYNYTGSLVVMSIYALIRVGLFPPLEWIAGKISVKKSYAFTLTLGMILMMGRLSFVLLYNEAFAIHGWLVYFVAALDGISGGMYFLSSNTLNQVVTDTETRVRYMSVQGIFNNLSNVLSPLLSAFIIDMSIDDNTGYLNIFKCVLVIFAIMVILAFRMKIDRSEDFTMKKKMWDKDDRKWNFCQMLTFIFGFRDSMMLTLTGIMVYNATGGSGSLYGKLLAFFALTTIIVFRMVSKKMNSGNLLKYYRSGSLLITTSTIILVLVPNIYGAIYYGLANAIGTPMFNTCYSIITMNIVQDYTKQENIVGRMIAKESALSLSRCLGMAMIVVFYLVLPENLYLQVSVILLSLTAFGSYVYANHYYKGQSIQ